MDNRYANHYIWNSPPVGLGTFSEPERPQPHCEGAKFTSGRKCLETVSEPHGTGDEELELALQTCENEIWSEHARTSIANGEAHGC